MEQQIKIGHTNKYAGMGKGTKEQAKDLAKYYGCTTKYSGKKKTMYIYGNNHKDAIVAIKALNPLFTVSD